MKLRKFFHVKLSLLGIIFLIAGCSDTPPTPTTPTALPQATPTSIPTSTATSAPTTTAPSTRTPTGERIVAERLIAHVDVQALLANDLEAAFSPDGRHFAFVENQKGKWVVLVDGIPQGGYDDFAKKSLQFNLDSAHVVYAAVNNGKRFIVLDGREEENDDYLGIPQFSPDGKRLGYKALAGKDNVAVIDGVESKPYDQVDIPHFSPDSRRVAYAARDAQQWLTVIDAKNVNATMVLTHAVLFIALIANTSRFGQSSGRNQ